MLSMSPAQQLRDLLQRTIACIPPKEFCGVGVVVCSNIEGMPIEPLCAKAALPAHGELAQQIATCSLRTSNCHDGFQFISAQWKLLARNQYFAPFPPTDQRARATTNGNVGSRFMAARFGSLIESVLCTGLLSERDGLVVFVDGAAVD